MILSTVQAARELGTSAQRLIRLIGKNRISAPAKNSSGVYVWTFADIQRTRQLLLTLPRGGRPSVEGCKTRPGAANRLPPLEDLDLDAFLAAARDRARELKHEGWANTFELLLHSKERIDSCSESAKQTKEMVEVG
jgi:hypothetical protein